MPNLVGPWYRELSPACWRTLTLAGPSWTFDIYNSFVLSLTLPALVTVFALTKGQAGAIGSILFAAGLVVGGRPRGRSSHDHQLAGAAF